jgi:hypothetical protein
MLLTIFLVISYNIQDSKLLLKMAYMCYENYNFNNINIKKIYRNHDGYSKKCHLKVDVKR